MNTDSGLSHIETLEAQIQRFEAHLLQGLAPWHALLVLLKTVPGIDQIGAAMLLVEIGYRDEPIRQRRTPGVLGGYLPWQP